MTTTDASELLKTTPLYEEHVSLQARVVPFAGYKMPVQYPEGIIAEHLWTRSSAGLFDVSHMGQALLIGPDHDSIATFLETLVPADIKNLAEGKQRYTQFLDENGGIMDDFMVSRPAGVQGKGVLTLVVNASMKENDFAHIEKHLPRDMQLVRKEDWALLALQGPFAESVLVKLGADIASMFFMDVSETKIGNIAVRVSRSGYTGEDGFEISVAAKDAVALWRLLLSDDRVHPVGLGARDSLRLEAGLCLYGHDIDTTTTPVEANLLWSIQKRRRTEGGFPGSELIQNQIAAGCQRTRVIIKPEGRVPAREGTEILSPEGEKIGLLTSGGFGPSNNGPIAMGYVAKAFAKEGQELQLLVRGKSVPAHVVSGTFVPHGYKRS